jgi:hypothetical protein
MASPTVRQILDKIAAIEADPKSLLPVGSSIQKYTPAARRRLDKLRRDVANEIRQEKLARGETVNDAGYSGRQTNRR